jgi:ribosome assembly protein 1
MLLLFSDVSTATRLCDGAIILVDVLEGVCTQTRAVLHKALKERMRPCLVLNKIDRLCLEMKLTPLEAFHHLRKVLENVNALAAQLVNSELNISAHSDRSQWSDELSEGWIFGSDRGNVLFASALDSWGFGVAKFANHWAQKMGLNREVLVKYMFEDYTLLASTKKIVKCTEEYRDCKPLFATLVLEPIWAVYDAAITEHNPEKASKMAKRALDIELEPREVNSKDPRSTAQAIFRRWLPLSDALLRMVVRCVPDPTSAQQKRILTLYPPLPVTGEL